MSVTDSDPSGKSAGPVVKKKPQRFHPATAPEQEAVIEPPSLSSKQKVMRELISSETLTRLARRRSADDERRRKLTCVTFFWMALLAFGPGGFATLHQMITFALAAHWRASVPTARAALSKEAVSENLRERPWQFFADVLEYLLTTYAGLWRQLAGEPQPLVVERLQVWLIDASIMRVALRLFQQFPARRTGKQPKWAALKLHLGLRVFQSLPEVLAITPEKQNDHKTGFLRPAGEAVLYIFDLGYWGYHLFDTILDQGQHLLSRLREDCNPLILAVTEGDPAWVGQRLKSIVLSGRQVDLRVHLSSHNIAHPQMRHDVRLVGQYVDRDQDWHLYVTSLLDPAVYPVSLLVDLYRLRWQIEILFRNLKCVLRIANFVSTTENGIRIQIYAALIHYVLTHLVILKAMQATGRKFEDFSVPHCLEGVQQVLQHTTQLIGHGVAPDWDELELRLIEVVVCKGLRPEPQTTASHHRRERAIAAPAAGFGRIALSGH